MMQNKIIWLTGGSGSGKSMAAQIFSELGVKVVDADAVAHKILHKDGAAYRETVLKFGGEILLPNGEIDRKKLGAAVFSDREKLDILNKITHKYIRRELRKAASGSAGSVVIDAALPPEGFLTPDKVITVTAPVKTRIERITARDGITAEEAENRIKSQPSDAEYESIADTVFENSGDTGELKAKIIKWCLDEKII